ncbi:hypothetical protein [Paraburkholderia fungorum]|uniref:hypothetical protein n=1 Tax=Paraburkholderia fungorum TaxID=134537 RepID=UPI0011B27A54|nr:hypothetical protein [Paraburkholderia fungorum]
MKRKQIGLRLSSDANTLFSEACRAVGEKKARVLAKSLSAVAELLPDEVVALAPRVAKGAGFDKPILVSVPLAVATQAADACSAAGLDLSEILRAQIDRWSHETLAMVAAQRKAREANITSDANLALLQTLRAEAFQYGRRWNVDVAARALRADKQELKNYAETNPRLRTLIERTPIDLALVEELAASGASRDEIAERTGVEITELLGRARREPPLAKALARPLDESALWAHLLSGASLREAAAATGTNLLRLRKVGNDDPLVHAAFELDAIGSAFAEIRRNLGALGEAERSAVDSLTRSRDEQLANLWASGPTGNGFASGEGPSLRERTTAGFAARLTEAAAEGGACQLASASPERASALSIAQRMLSDAHEIAARLADVVSRIERTVASGAPDDKSNGTDGRSE